MFALVDSVLVSVYNLEYCDPVYTEQLRNVGRGFVKELLVYSKLGGSSSSSGSSTFNALIMSNIIQMMSIQSKDPTQKPTIHCAMNIVSSYTQYSSGNFPSRSYMQLSGNPPHNCRALTKKAIMMIVMRLFLGLKCTAFYPIRFFILHTEQISMAVRTR